MAKRLMVYDPNWSLPFLISAAAPFLQGKRQRTIQELKAALEKNQRLVGVRLALVRLLMDAGQVEEALDRLDDVMVQDLTPDMLMMVASMYETAKQLDRIGSLFNTAISLAQDDVGMMQKILEWRAGYYVRQGQFEDAAKDYEALLKMYPEDPLALAGLVTVYAEMQSDLAARYADALLPPPDISEVRLDVDALEANVPGLGHRYTTRHSAEKKKTPKKIKKRANPPAKNYDPEKEPDPERWLPKRERAGYKPKKRGRAGKMGGSSQGVALSDGGLGGTGSARIEG
jgi:signal recognition particle subunit SRP72